MARNFILSGVLGTWPGRYILFLDPYFSIGMTFFPTESVAVGMMNVRPGKGQEMESRQRRPGRSSPPLARDVFRMRDWARKGSQKDPKTRISCSERDLWKIGLRRKNMIQRRVIQV